MCLVVHPLAVLDVAACQWVLVLFATQLRFACERLRVVVVSPLFVVVAHCFTSVW